MLDGSAWHDGRDSTGGCVLLEVRMDSCIVRITTKGSRHYLKGSGGISLAPFLFLIRLNIDIRRLNTLASIQGL
jgi:hypothetical protein